MTRLTHEMDVSSSCDLESVDFIAFMEATTLIGGRDVVEEFLARGLQPLGHRFGFLVETKESPLSKITMLMPQIDAGSKSLVSSSQHVLRKLLTSWLADTILHSIRPTRGFVVDELIAFWSLPGFIVCPAPSLPGVNVK
jgi:hypothetical protein